MQPFIAEEGFSNDEYTIHSFPIFHIFVFKVVNIANGTCFMEIYSRVIID